MRAPRPALSLSLSCATRSRSALALCSPPRGWRSWNLYGNNVNQTLITGIMDGMVKKQTFGGGKPTSLCDLGYCDVGLDDHWQACGSPDAAPGMHYHDKDGNPIVNKEVFPDMKAMVDHAHSLKLTSGWYGNNCDCSDHCDKPGGVDSPVCQKQIEGDVKALHDFGFDAWKLDGCGGETDLVAVNKAIKAAGKPIMVVSAAAPLRVLNAGASRKLLHCRRTATGAPSTRSSLTRPSRRRRAARGTYA